MLSAVLFTGCKKDDQVPPVVRTPVQEMNLINLNDIEVKQGMPAMILDLNGDGKNDIAFGTMLVGDPIYMVDKVQFVANSDIDTNMPVNTNEYNPVMNEGDSIPLNDFSGYKWYRLSSVMLMQKIIGMNVPVIWEGNWKNAIKKYLPVQVVKNSKRFNGWILLSTDTINENIILHSAAVCKYPEMGVKIKK